ncbi:MAG: hypothetical protein K2O91_21600 [Lachnospiraceae bacterium]|nr:hypothetical protein [Lachnospiraceae bacterium]
MFQKIPIYETIHEMVNTLDNKRKKLFIYMLLNRQKNVYDFLAENKIWDRREEVNHIFQIYLKCILEDKYFPEKVIIEIVDYNPENIGWEENEDNIMGYMITFMDNVWVFANQLTDEGSKEPFYSRFNYDFLDGFIDEMYDSSQPLLETDIMKLEIEREIRDYEMLKNMKYIDCERLTKSEEMLIDQKAIKQFNEPARRD